jgi:hypothetical protein
MAILARFRQDYTVNLPIFFKLNICIKLKNGEILSEDRWEIGWMKEERKNRNTNGWGIEIKMLLLYCKQESESP